MGGTIPLKQECWKRFNAVTGFDVDNFCIDCYYFFENSSKRKGVLSEFCEFVDVEFREILKLKHVNVRWLSLERAVSRILSQYESLKSYFLSESDNSPRFTRLQKAFSNPVIEVNLLFFHAVMPMFTTPNKMLQKEDRCLYIIDDIIDSFLKVVQAKFVKVRVLRDADGWDKVDYEDPDNQLPDENMTVGFRNCWMRVILPQGIAESSSMLLGLSTLNCRLVQKPHVPQ